jgi:hypothetical protein
MSSRFEVFRSVVHSSLDSTFVFISQTYVELSERALRVLLVEQELLTLS